MIGRLYEELHQNDVEYYSVYFEELYSDKLSKHERLTNATKILDYLNIEQYDPSLLDRNIFKSSENTQSVYDYISNYDQLKALAKRHGLYSYEEALSEIFLHGLPQSHRSLYQENTYLKLQEITSLRTDKQELWQKINTLQQQFDVEHKQLHEPSLIDVLRSVYHFIIPIKLRLLFQRNRQ